MSYATQLVSRCHGHGARLAVEAGKLRVRAPEPLPDELVAELRTHRDELLAELTRRLSPIEAGELVGAAFAGVDAWYAEGALGELDRDTALGERFEATERAIDAAAGAPGGPTAAELGAALAEHVECVRECVSRSRARRELAA